MLLRFLIFIGIIISVSCHHDKPVTQKFDSEKWKSRDGRDFPYRDEMLDSLVFNHELIGKSKKVVYEMLGEPSRTDTNYLFYQVAQQRLGSFVLHSKTLVVFLDSTDVVKMIKIHQ